MRVNVGDRVRLEACNDPHTRLEPGAVGTVTFIDDLDTVHVRWDDGHTLGLVPAAGDRFEVLEPCAECNGTGIVPVEPWRSNRSRARTAKPCPRCSKTSAQDRPRGPQIAGGY